MPTIYLSPSLQPYNKYVGGGDEQYYMNLVADAMVPYLRANGIQYSRNTVGTSPAQAIRESNSGYYDLHLALHSNAAPEHLSGKLQGTDVYYYQYSNAGKRAADIIAQNFKQIYPDPSKVRALPTTTLVELTKTNAPAVLIEIAYHDNVQDADWIRNNIDAIAKNIVKSLTEYFGLPFISNVEAPKQGTVVTQGSPLNIRARPSTDAQVVGQIPKGATFTVLGRWQDWYVVNYNGTVGYASASFIRV